MAEDKLHYVMEDLQKHLLNANVKVSNLSNVAKNGDEKLVEKFISEAVFSRNTSENKLELAENKTDIIQSQLYVACFWGFRDVVRGILSLADESGIEVDVNNQNKNTLWTPLHAATFQEHGPIVMQLLQSGANPQIEDSEGRTSTDFASASDKVWPHFQAQGLQRTAKATLVSMGILRNSEFSNEGGTQESSAARGYSMASYQNPDFEENDPNVNAARGGDVLANDDKEQQKSGQPQFKIYK